MKALARYGKAFGGYRMIDVPKPECGPEDIIIEIKAANLRSRYEALQSGQRI